MNQVISDSFRNRIEELHCKYGISLTRHREWTDTGLIERLADVFDGLQEPTKCALLSLRDHKGRLEVIWNKKPTPGMRCEVDHVWERIGNEVSDGNVHMTIGTIYWNTP